MRVVERGYHSVSIYPQKTLPHVESIRHNLVFYQLLQKKQEFSGPLCLRVCERVRTCILKKVKYYRKG